MSALSLDTDQARIAGAALIRDGDAAYDSGLTLRTLLDDMRLAWHGFAARTSVEEAAAELWRAGTFLHLVSDAVESADRLDPGAVAPATIDRCREMAEGLVGGGGWFGRFPGNSGVSPRGGDLHGTNVRELRSPYTIFGDTDADRARALLMRALADTGDANQIRADEFGIVRLDDDQYVIVLPGVTDLSGPDPFLSREHRSVRDLDQFAVVSSRSTSVEDNRYAQMVWTAIAAAGVPPGSKLMLVGHSFGADTALDLAADEDFNGAGGYRVTHVVAAGYYSQPQLERVPPSTEVLVLQSHRDAAVIVEGIGQSNAADYVTASARTVERVVAFDVVGALGAGWDTVTAQVGMMIDAGEYVYDHGDDFVDIGAGIGSLDWNRVGDGVSDLVTLQPGVDRFGDHAVVDVFEGGSAGNGHDPANYVAHVDRTDHALVTGFFTSIASAGYARTGSAVAVDISVPR